MEKKAADDHGNQAFLGYHLAVLLQLAPEARLGSICDERASKHNSYGDAEERQSSDTFIPTAGFLECNWVRFKEKVQNAVHNRHLRTENISTSDISQEPGNTYVEGDEKQNRFQEEHGERSCDELLHDVTEIYLTFVMLGMDCPIARLIANLFSPTLQQNWRICLRDNQETDSSKEESRDKNSVMYSVHLHPR